MGSTPQVDYSQLTIIRPSAEQASKATANSYPRWGAPVGIQTLAAYDDAFNAVYCDPSTPWGSAGAVVDWVLVPRSDPTTLDILAHCTTIRRNALVVRSAADREAADTRTPAQPGKRRPSFVAPVPPGGVEDVTSYAIVAVFTPEPHRGNHYARHMLRLLHYVLAAPSDLPPFPAEWGSPPADHVGDAAFSVLYSAVGKDYYAKATKGLDQPGWLPHFAPTRIWKVGEEAPFSDDWKVLDAHSTGLLERAATDKQRAALAAPGLTATTRLAIAFDGGWFRYFPTWSGFFAKAANDPTAPRRIQRCCVRLPPTASGEEPYVVFTAEKRKDGGTSLLVQHVQHPVSLAVLLAIAAHEGADELDVMGTYEGWDEERKPDRMLQLGGELGATPAVASYAWKDGVEWLWNEHCFWC